MVLTNNDNETKTMTSRRVTWGFGRGVWEKGARHPAHFNFGLQVRHFVSEDIPPGDPTTGGEGKLAGHASKKLEPEDNATVTRKY